MRVFSRITFIFNIGFLLAFLMQLTEVSILPASVFHGEGFTAGMAIILTFYILSGLVNFVFFLFVLSFIIRGKDHGVPKWILYINIVLLIWQFFYFFVI